MKAVIDENSIPFICLSEFTYSIKTKERYDIIMVHIVSMPSVQRQFSSTPTYMKYIITCANEKCNKCDVFF